MPHVRRLPEGKLPIHVLGEMLGSIQKGSAVVPASVGVDVGVTRTRGRFLVSSSDPITGAEKNIGWHAVHVSANDVATSGIMPDCLSVVSLFPPRTRFREIMGVMGEINRTAAKLGITVVGGHTETTTGLKRPIIVVTCFGTGSRFVTAADALAGDSILMTKTAGIEGTAILSSLGKVKASLPPPLLIRASSLIKKLSIVREAGVAFSTGRVHAMHDVTEGGVIGAVFEMGFASRLGFELDSKAVRIERATGEVSRVLKIDPLKLIGSGSLLIACDETSESIIKGKLEGKKIACSRIGKFVPLKNGRVLISGSQRRTVSERSIQDELWRALGKFGNYDSSNRTFL